MEHSSYEQHPVFSYFKRINDVPRCSNDEENIARLLVNIGKELQLDTRTDQAGNVLISKDSSQGEKLPHIILQGHMDMVCMKDEDSDHDFCKAPIEMEEESGWLTAKGTTLGADNGIGVAMGLALLSENLKANISVLVTRTEETGMDGALGLDPSFLEADALLNLDSEEEGFVTCGCAGGTTAKITLPIAREERTDYHHCLALSVANLKGGHSGMEIQNVRSNAIKVMADLLREIDGETVINIHDLSSGTKHNAIPHEAKAVISFAEDSEHLVLQTIEDAKKKILPSLLKIEPDVTFTWTNVTTDVAPLTKTAKMKLFSIIGLLPHGVYSMNPDNKTVEASDNLAIVQLTEDEADIWLSIRSSKTTKIKEIQAKFQEIADIVQADLAFSDGYPAWEFKEESKLRDCFQKLHVDFYGQRAEVLDIHAGLECGLFAQKNPSLDMISFGPDITGAHTTKEKVNIESVYRSYDFLVQLIQAINESW